jgi:AraC-like DNA-binding protein
MDPVRRSGRRFRPYQAVVRGYRLPLSLAARRRVESREGGDGDGPPILLTYGGIVHYYYRVSEIRTQGKGGQLLLDRYERARDAAAVKTLERIQRDREVKASPRIKPLLTYIENHLLDPGLSVAKLRESCGVRDNAFSTGFTRDLGTSPRDYIRKRRMEVAARLLVETGFQIWKIGDLVCYANASTFGQAFKDWSGSKPTDYRKVARKAAREAESLEVDVQELARALRQGEVAELDRDLRVRLADYLLSFDEPPRTLAMDGGKLERGMALAYWEDLRHLPATEQLELVRRPYGMATTALFDLLREKSREEGRKDRQVGVRLARLALASLDGLAGHLTPDELANRRAQGWAWIANALRLALDFPAAERAFARARKLLPKGPDLQVLAEVYELEADLFLFQSRFEEALELGDRALTLFRSLGQDDLLARSLLARARTLSRAKSFESAIPDLVDALKLLEPRKDRELTAAVHHSLLTAYVYSGRIEQAIEILPAARVLCASTGDRLMVHQLQWVEGHIASEQGRFDHAEELLLAARAGLVSVGEIGYAAAVDLELAEGFLKQRREPEAVLHALRGIPVFERFRAHPEAMAALALLGEIAAEQEIRLEVVQEIRGYLEHLLQSPVGFKGSRAGFPALSAAPSA